MTFKQWVHWFRNKRKWEYQKKCKHQFIYLGFAPVGDDLLGGHKFKCVICDKVIVKKRQ
jgi:hypothetical protein